MCKIVKIKFFTRKIDRSIIKIVLELYLGGAKDIIHIFITKHLELGYWNEVLALCEKLCECKFKSIRAMLVGNHFF